MMKRKVLTECQVVIQRLGRSAAEAGIALCKVPGVASLPV